jgi:hypothetical protein
MLLTATLLCGSHIVAAESLPDPTRPAIEVGGGTGQASGVTAAPAAPRGLQSIIISPEYRAAIINGVTVPQGGKSGDSTLVEVRESSVVLQNAHGRRVLELFPKVNMKMTGQAEQKNGVPEKASGQPGLPEEEGAGGTK